MNEISSLFVDENEKVVAALGGSYIQNYLSTGGLSRGFCVVSDKRVYFKGKCYSKNGNSYRAKKEEKIVDLKDITSTGFSAEMTLKWLILGCVFLFIGFMSIIIALARARSYYGSVDFFIYLFGISTIVSVVSWILYFIKRKKMFEIAFAGGTIAFKRSGYSQQETRNFQKALRIAKDNYIQSVYVRSIS